MDPDQLTEFYTRASALGLEHPRIVIAGDLPGGHIATVSAKIGETGVAILVDPEAVKTHGWPMILENKLEAIALTLKAQA